MSDVPLTALQVNEALASGESDRIVATLEALAASARRGEFVEVAPPKEDWLDDLADVLESLLIAYFDLLYTYPLLTPDLTPQQVRTRVLDADLVHGGPGPRSTTPFSSTSIRGPARRPARPCSSYGFEGCTTTTRSAWPGFSSPICSTTFRCGR